MQSLVDTSRREFYRPIVMRPSLPFSVFRVVTEPSVTAASSSDRQNPRQSRGALTYPIPYRQTIRSILLLLIQIPLTPGCRRPAVSVTPAAEPTIASTVPSVTDLLIGMGCGNHLVAVSNYDDPNRPEIRHLPRAGDLMTIDWEVIAAARPRFLITGLREGRRPAGFDQRAAALHVKVIYVQVNGRADIDPAIDLLGELLNEKAKAAAAKKSLDARLNAVTTATADRPRVPTLLVLGPDPTRVAGPGSYLDDLLAVAGGVNVVPATANPYPTLDRERIIALHPQQIIQLLPAATAAESAQARAAWATLPEVTAKVHVITDPYAQQPGWHVAALAEEMMRDLAAR
jgi:iron complex transport system substrate-binding protein